MARANSSFAASAGQAMPPQKQTPDVPARLEAARLEAARRNRDKGRDPNRDRGYER
jgi:hypothetical protein